MHIKALALSNRGEATSLHSFPLGKLTTEDLGVIEIDEEISAKETYETDTVSSKLSTIHRAEVTIAINHKWPDEVKFNLTDPSGNKYPLTFNDTEGPDVEKTFDLPMKENVADGNWTLEAKNRSQFKVLTLKHWKLKLSNLQCE